MDSKKSLATLISRRDQEKIPPDIWTRIEKIYTDVHGKLRAFQSLHNETQKNICKLCLVNYTKYCDIFDKT